MSHDQWYHNLILLVEGIYFGRVSRWNTTSFRIWTHEAESTSYDYNRYDKSVSFIREKESEREKEREREREGRLIMTNF